MTRRASRPLDAYVLSWEDSCLPVDLRFDPPLVEYGWPGPFSYHWQLLTYEFALPDPTGFPFVTGFTPAEVAELRRYVTVCQELAGSAALRHHAAMAVNAVTGQVTYEPLASGPNVFESLSTRLRQLHCTSGAGPGYESVAKVLRRHALAATDSRSVERIGLLTRWDEARDALLARPLRTLVARSVLRQHRKPVSDANDDDVRPDDILARLDFGRMIASDRTVTARDSHAFMVSTLGLCHLYFGFAQLVQAAMGTSRAM